MPASTGARRCRRHHFLHLLALDPLQPPTLKLVQTRLCIARLDCAAKRFRDSPNPVTLAGRSCRCDLAQGSELMNVFMLYLILLKATVTTFSGLA